MKCKQCGIDFPNLNALTKHKETCTGACVSKTEQAAQSPPDGQFLIPLSICPEEVSLYAMGHTVGLSIQCTLKPEGLFVQEVKLIR